MLCILILFVVVQILFHSSLSDLIVEASRFWCGIGMLVSFVRSVVAALSNVSAFSFPSFPWCEGIQVIIICLWSLVSSVYIFCIICVISCFSVVLFLIAFIEVRESVWMTAD